MVSHLQLKRWLQSRHGTSEVDKKDADKQQEVAALGRVKDKVACRVS